MDVLAEDAAGDAGNAVELDCACADSAAAMAVVITKASFFIRYPICFSRSAGVIVLRISGCVSKAPPAGLFELLVSKINATKMESNQHLPLFL